MSKRTSYKIVQWSQVNACHCPKIHMEIDGGDGCTLWMCLILLKCTLKNGQGGRIDATCILSQILKLGKRADGRGPTGSGLFRWRVQERR